jgi:FtsP/CotA-like multicopper oxidase with cupredoxin domain
MKAGAPLLSVKRGSVVSLGFVNRSQVNQAMRLHGHVMRQLHLMDDGWEPYWRDSVIVPAGRTVRVAFVADNPGRWRIGSGIMAHAAGGMSGFFEVS